MAFTVRDRSSDELARHLAAEGLGVGAGDFYAYRLVEALGAMPTGLASGASAATSVRTDSNAT